MDTLLVLDLKASRGPFYNFCFSFPISRDKSMLIKAILWSPAPSPNLSQPALLTDRSPGDV